MYGLRKRQKMKNMFKNKNERLYRNVEAEFFNEDLFRLAIFLRGCHSKTENLYLYPTKTLKNLNLGYV